MPVANTKALISCAVTAPVLAQAKIRFSHSAAHFVNSIKICRSRTLQTGFADKACLFSKLNAICMAFTWFLN